MIKTDGTKFFHLGHISDQKDKKSHDCGGENSNALEMASLFEYLLLASLLGALKGKCVTSVNMQ